MVADHGSIVRQPDHHSVSCLRKYPLVKPRRPAVVRHWSAHSDPRVAVLTLGYRKPPSTSDEWIEYVPAPDWAPTCTIKLRNNPSVTISGFSPTLHSGRVMTITNVGEPTRNHFVLPSNAKPVYYDPRFGTVYEWKT